MPFGLCNTPATPATFQRLMHRCSGVQLNGFLLIYLDDVIMYLPNLYKPTRTPGEGILARLEQSSWSQERAAAKPLPYGTRREAPASDPAHLPSH
ncbi:hypothetical protein AAFF_G00067100 [Aldrovandia affinis]|uniref:Reverse transcriptase domain-containing protein n=1 Tax=Aldrovandia affinis TaxID=143900 RepID=A0AAD7T5B9_9TELE|nr:hypothetical protein AAFF_G00067100 [Aldrovandia affinis]